METTHLCTFEREALLEALRRDMRREQDRAGEDPTWASWHRRNARNDLRLLEMINPKQRRAPEASGSAARGSHAPTADATTLHATEEAA